AIPSIPLVAGPGAQKRQYGKNNRLGQRGQAREQTEANPGEKPAGILKLQSNKEKPTEQQGDETGRPGPVRAVVNPVRRKRPTPPCPLRHTPVKAAARQKKYRNTGERREYAVYRQRRHNGRRRVGPQQPEHTGQ